MVEPKRIRKQCKRGNIQDNQFHPKIVNNRGGLAERREVTLITEITCLIYIETILKGTLHI